MTAKNRCPFCHKLIELKESYMTEKKRLYHTVCWYKSTETGMEAIS